MKEEGRLGESKKKINGNEWASEILSALLTLFVCHLGEAGGSFEIVLSFSDWPSIKCSSGQINTKCPKGEKRDYSASMVHTAILGVCGISGNGLGLEFQEFLWQLGMIVWLEMGQMG